MNSPEEVQSRIDLLKREIEVCGYVDMATYMEFFQMRASYNDYFYGWENLSSAYVKKRLSGKYVAVMPDPIKL
jgi:hypothetical protein